MGQGQVLWGQKSREGPSGAQSRAGGGQGQAGQGSGVCVCVVRGVGSADPRIRLDWGGGGKEWAIPTFAPC